MLSSYKNHQVEFGQLHQFSFPTNEDPFLLTINKDKVKFDFLLRIKRNSSKAIVFGSGAYDASSELRPPIFQRHKWIQYFDETTIFYNDPTLYLNKLNIGWGVGIGERHYLTEIAEILIILLEKLSIKNEKTLFYGSSAGGFMSLMLSGLIKESTALINNPQTIVWNYNDKHVNALFSTIEPQLTRNEIINRHTKRLNIIEFYKDIQYVPKINYVQNVSCLRDVEKHLNPFLIGLEQLDDHYYTDEIKVTLYSDKELGHSPLKLNESLKYIQNIVSNL
ncbi:glycosyl transferase family 2 [Sutcliffiella sp. NC1]|uniref:glycosyl transferase family 2 n=1 Tax=Sutcliffiella sp. NC1 TaxID=3004096 RepID=UPI0022DD34DD|nr:glycosyl transferase family 2 [Sutcliffiella sp. NC1]WBL14540.1 glycosyl transferase family 2 [Sutcliffiella sp. NC1]